MPPATNEEQFRFLISCIRWSNNGKVDFTEVAKECQVVSKGAAAKRYERMMRAHGIHPNGGPGRAPTARQPKVERNAGPTPTKKAKSKAAALDENMNVDDEEEPPLFSNLKSENGQDEEFLVVKTELDQDRSTYEGSDLQHMQSCATPEMSRYTMGDNGYESAHSGYATPSRNPYGMSQLNSYAVGNSPEHDRSPRTLQRQNSPSEEARQYQAGPIVITD